MRGHSEQLSGNFLLGQLGQLISLVKFRESCSECPLKAPAEVRHVASFFSVMALPLSIYLLSTLETDMVTITKKSFLKINLKLQPLFGKQNNTEEEGIDRAREHVPLKWTVDSF